MTYRSIRTACLSVPGLLIPLSILGLNGSSRAAVVPEQAELAERLLQTAQRLLPSDAGKPVAAALVDAAERLFENDARLLRVAADLRLSLGQREQAIKLLGAYRRLDPADQVSQVQSIDLITDGMETADAKADYLTKVMGADAVVPEVRSHAALLLVGVESQRGRDDDAAKALDTALKLDPLNRRALQLKLDAVMRDGKPPEQANALVNLLLAEPLQVAAYTRLAETLARSGASSQAIDMYGQVFRLLESSAFLPTPDDSFNYCALLLAANGTKDAQNVVQAALKVDPTQARGHYLRILGAWRANDSDDAKAAIETARQQLIQNIAALQTPPADGTAAPAPATQSALPDIAAGVQKIQSQNNPQSAEAYLAALGDLAWLDVYFANRAPDASVLAGIDTLAGPSSALSNRIAGFAAIAAGQNDEAKVKFSAVAERDPLSQLGLLILQLKADGDKTAVVTAGNALLQKLPTDAWSEMVRWSLKDAGPLSLQSADRDAVIAEAAKLPRKWMEFLRDAQGFYFVTVDVLKANVQIGEPMLVSVAVQNATDRPLTIGTRGAIEPVVPVDANVRGALEQQFPAAAIARLTGKIVLKPREQCRTVVRLDSAALENFSTSNPQTGISVFLSAITNPQIRGRAMGPGPGGFRAQAKNVLNRSPVSYARAEVRAKVAEQLRSNDATERLRAVATIGACAAWMSAAADDQKQFAGEAIDQLQRTADRDGSATVRAMAWQQLAMRQDEPQRTKTIEGMLASADFEARAIGCVMSLGRPLTERQRLLGALAGDTDTVIAGLAKSVIELPDAASTTQPLATQPPSGVGLDDAQK